MGRCSKRKRSIDTMPAKITSTSISGSEAAAVVGCLLTVHDVAARLSVPVTWVYSKAEAGELPGALKVGRYLRFDPRAIDDYLALQLHARQRGPRS